MSVLVVAGEFGFLWVFVVFWLIFLVVVLGFIVGGGGCFVGYACCAMRVEV